MAAGVEQSDLVAPGAGLGPAGAADPQQERQGLDLPRIARMAIQVMAVHYAFMWMTGMTKRPGGQTTSTAELQEETSITAAASTKKGSSSGKKKPNRPMRFYKNMFDPAEETYDFWVHLLTEDEWKKMKKNTHAENKKLFAEWEESEKLLWHEKNIPYNLKDKQILADKQTPDSDFNVWRKNVTVPLRLLPELVLPSASDSTSGREEDLAQQQGEQEKDAAGTNLVAQAVKGLMVPSSASNIKPDAITSSYLLAYTMRSTKLRKSKHLYSYETIHERVNLTRMMRPKVHHEEKSLLGGGGADDQESEKKNATTTLAAIAAPDKDGTQPGASASSSESRVSSKNASSTSTNAEVALALEHENTRNSTTTSPTASPSSSTKVAHWVSKVDFRIVWDDSVHNDATLNNEISTNNNPLAAIKRFPDSQVYQPLVSATDFWALEHDFLHLNSTVLEKGVSLEAVHGKISNTKDDEAAPHDPNVVKNVVDVVFDEAAPSSTNHHLAAEPSLPLRLSHYQTTYAAWSIQKSLTDTLTIKENFGLLIDPMRESFMLKKIFLSNSPIVLILSMLFMLSHSLFSWLAFKNDLQFWRKNKSMKGLSARSMVIGWVSRVVIALYLLESRETSYLILFEIGLDLVLSTWKLTKAIKVEVVFAKILYGKVLNLLWVKTMNSTAHEKDEVLKNQAEDDRQVDQKSEFDESVENSSASCQEQEEHETVGETSSATTLRHRPAAVAATSAEETTATGASHDVKINREKAANGGETADTLDKIIDDKTKPKISKPSSAKAKPSFIETYVLKISSKTGYDDDQTSEYDQIAVRYMSYLLYPLLGCYTVYTLVYNVHKSWYSFILKTLAGYIYVFGFIMMTPQLYINYRLKSVEHMPWRAMTYKALNTFVDDVSAFLMDMPWMHRLSCLRDDVIFFAYLYQRWAYRVDKTRPTAFSDGEKVEQQELKSSAEGEDAEGSRNSPALEDNKQVGGAIAIVDGRTEVQNSTGRGNNIEMIHQHQGQETEKENQRQENDKTK
ncbi:unnamed protein product [Amoebophrya sp. A120]|nr:unnamed protein product [Amoebophrya sp. A120]|eukprot:GSA120T00007640001.1